MTEASTRNYVAVIDIGSNAVRFAVYDGLSRAPFRIHNERRQCHLGKTLAATGRLNPEGVQAARESLGRFAALIRAMGIRHVRAVATAAMRDAADGPEFIRKIKDDFGLHIKIIEGDEEARLAALGVMMNGLGAKGVIGDYGGGSLEIIYIDGGRVRRKTSLPIGAHRLHALPEKARARAVEAQLAGVKFLKSCRGADFYAIGGAWRSIGRAHLRRSRHPVQTLDQYAVPGAEARAFAGLLARQQGDDLRATLGAEQRRMHDIGVAALALERLFAVLKPKRLVFSATGLREGLIFDSLPAAAQKQDALIASCEKTGLETGRFADAAGFKTLAAWMAPLFAGQGAETKRLVAAACCLGDVGWLEHEDHQAAHAFSRMLQMPLYGIDHPGRAFLARAQSARYTGPEAADDFVAATLLDRKTAQAAVAAGLAQRLAYLLTGGALGLLKDSRLAVTPKKITLHLKGRAKGLADENVVAALQELAAAVGKTAAVE